MPAPLLSEIERTSAELTEALGLHGTKALLQVDGPPGAGKSACLAQLAGRLRDETDLKPIIVAPPSQHLDAGAVALADVATGLGTNSLLNGELEGWMGAENVATWSERVCDVERWVGANAQQVVLLFDDPRGWGANRDDDDIFRQRGLEAAMALSKLHCRRVIAGELPLPWVTPDRKVKLSTPTIDPQWLEQPGEWGALSSAVVEVGSSSLLEKGLNPLQVRLLIGMTALTSIAETTSWFECAVSDPGSRAVTRAMVERLADTIRAGCRRAWIAWLRVSLTRRSFDREILDVLLSGSAPALERDLVRHCLLFGEETMRMHDDVRRYAIRWRKAHRHEGRERELLRKATRRLFEVYKKRFDRTRDAGRLAQALYESIEAYHFASSSGDQSLLSKVSPVFGEQLDALGWSLSYEHRDYERAAAAFEQALRWDPGDHYAHHYLAYNLDRLGVRVDDVERHYRKAVQLDREHPWWRARLIVFLIARGRLGEAEAEWNEAVLELSAGEGDASRGVYEHLHAWVAGALLDAGEPAFARRVLDEIPVWAQSSAYTDLSQRADALLQLGDGDAVVPAWRLRPGWWREGPERLQFKFLTGEQRVKWLAGRVERVDEKGMHVRAAVVENDGEQPYIAWTTITKEQFAEWCQDEVDAKDIGEGAFLELGFYVAPSKAKAPVQSVIRVLAPREWKTAGLSEMRSDRYIDLPGDR